MLSLGKYRDLQLGIFGRVEPINRLEALHKRILEFADLIWSDETRRVLDVPLNHRVDDFQDPIENLTAEIESEIDALKRIVRDMDSELTHELFFSDDTD